MRNENGNEDLSAARGIIGGVIIGVAIWAAVLIIFL